MPLPRATSSARLRRFPALDPHALVVVWSLVFAALHVYWAVGGRAGLGPDAAEADAALARTPFFIYNLAAAGLALGGAAIAVVLARGRPGWRVRRHLLLAATVAGTVLLVRGAVGLSLLGVSVLGGTFDPQTPAVLLTIEPWFLAGGLAFTGMVVTQRRLPHGAESTRPAPDCQS